MVVLTFSLGHEESGRRRQALLFFYFLRQDRAEDAAQKLKVRTIKQRQEFPTWKLDALKFRNSLEVSVDFKPFTAPVGQSPPVIRGMKPTERVLNILDVIAASRLIDCKKSEVVTSNWKRGLFADVSQNVGRRVFSSLKGEVKCLTTTSQIFNFETSRMLLSREHARLQGFPTMDFSMMSDSEIRTATGESFAMPCITFVVGAVFSAVSF